MARLGRAPSGAFRKVFVRFRGGPGFILALGATVAGWISWNLFVPSLRFDAPPFVLLNLLLSVEAAFTMPVLWMEQKEVALADRDALTDIAKRVREVLRVLEEEDAE